MSSSLSGISGFPTSPSFPLNSVGQEALSPSPHSHCQPANLRRDITEGTLTEKLGDIVARNVIHQAPWEYWHQAVPRQGSRLKGEAGRCPVLNSASGWPRKQSKSHPWGRRVSSRQEWVTGAGGSTPIPDLVPQKGRRADQSTLGVHPLTPPPPPGSAS